MDISIDSYGLPTSIGTSVPSTLLVENPDQTQSYGFLSTLEGWFDKSVDAVGAAADSAIEGSKKAIGELYGAGKTVVTDVGTGAEHLLGFTTNQAVLLVLALGVGLYLAGKSGALKISI